MGFEKNRSAQVKGSAYHFCSIDSFKKIIETNSIIATDIRMMNDDEELLYAKEIILEYLNNKHKVTGNEEYTKIAEEYKRQLEESSPHIACFSNKLNDIAWKRYGDKGNGVSIRFNSSKFGIGAAPFTLEDIFFCKVYYGRDDICKNLVDTVFLIKDKEIEKIENTARRLVNITCIFKRAGTIYKWEDEEERRIIYIPRKLDIGNINYIEKDGNRKSYYSIKFKDFDYKEIIDDIILGPNNRDIKKIRNILNTSKFKYSPIISYEKAKVLEKVRYDIRGYR